ncbi:MAG: hypothetical protein Q8L72_06410 [Moraxellaceae bacterium]|nr:hypothetical protein [Moraxellaceae bacterium]
MIDRDKTELKKYLLWMKENWENNHWSDPEHHYSRIWPAICKLAADQVLEEDLSILIDWTNPRSEIYSGMQVPQDVNNDDGWGGCQKDK